MRRLWFAIVILCPGLATGQKIVPSAEIPEAEDRLLHASVSTPFKCIPRGWSAHVDDGFAVEAAYNVVIPLDQYPKGTDHKWDSFVRIEPDKQPSRAVYFTDSFDEDSENVAVAPYIRGKGPVLSYHGFSWTGKGKFTAYQLIVDSQGRGCRIKWRFSAKDAAHDTKLSLPDNAVTEMSVRGLAQPVDPSQSPAVSRFTVLLDVTPRSGPNPRSLPADLKTQPILRMLTGVSAVARRIPAGSVRLICFSLDRQNIIYRDDDFHAGSLDSLERLENAIAKVNFGTVDYSVVRNQQGHLALLAQLIHDELHASPAAATVIFMGGPERFGDKLPPDSIETSASNSKLFYLRPEQPERLNEDSVTLAVKADKGIVLPYRFPWEFERAVERIEEAVGSKAR